MSNGRGNKRNFEFRVSNHKFYFEYNTTIINGKKWEIQKPQTF